MPENIWAYLLEHLSIASIGALLTFLTILFTFYKQVAIPMYNSTVKPVVDLVSSIYRSPTRLEHLDTKLDEIIKELKPNGGSSIKDQLNRLETSVSISEAQRMLLLDSVTTGIWSSDVKGRCTWVNEALRKSTGASLSDFIGTNWENVIHPEDRELVGREWERAISQKRDFNLYYRLINLATEKPVPVHGVATPAYNFNKEVIGWNGIIYFTEGPAKVDQAPSQFQLPGL
jgi:PAS domain S-box-containing protein